MVFAIIFSVAVFVNCFFFIETGSTGAGEFFLKYQAADKMKMSRRIEKAVKKHLAVLLVRRLLGE